MIQIILVRHGETEWNTAEVFRGRADIPLNETGLKQAELLSQYLNDEKLETVYSGPLSRAVKTAQIIAAPHSLPVNIVSNLDDLDCGEWEGKPLAEVKEKYPDLYQDWEDTPEQVRIPGGESLADVHSRAIPFIQDAVARIEEGTLVFVSHRAVHKVIISALLTLNESAFWNFRLDNCGITRFAFDGRRAVLTAHNDTSFLKGFSKKPLKDF